MNYVHYIGIDVSKNTLDFAVLEGKTVLLQMQTTNDAFGIKDFMKHLRVVSKQFKITQAVFCMEHTGIYNHHLLQYLFSKNAHVCLEAAVHIKMSSGLQRGKSDKVDAVRIAQYAYRNRDELKLWTPKREALRELKYYVAMRNRLINAKKQLSVALKETGEFDKQAARQTQSLCSSSIAALARDIEKTEATIDKLIAADEELTRLFRIVTSVQGIGKVTATAIILTTNEFKDISDPRKYACYAGVAPFEYASGISVRGKTGVSDRANKTVKSLLHMSAMTAICYNDDLKQYYERKVAQNKNKMAVINAVRNKLIHRVFACVRENKLYQKI